MPGLIFRVSSRDDFRPTLSPKMMKRKPNQYRGDVDGGDHHHQKTGTAHATFPIPTNSTTTNLRRNNHNNIHNSSHNHNHSSSKPKSSGLSSSAHEGTTVGFGTKSRGGGGGKVRGAAAAATAAAAGGGGGALKSSSSHSCQHHERGSSSGPPSIADDDSSSSPSSRSKHYDSAAVVPFPHPPKRNAGGARQTRRTSTGSDTSMSGLDSEAGATNPRGGGGGGGSTAEGGGGPAATDHKHSSFGFLGGVGGYGNGNGGKKKGGFPFRRRHRTAGCMGGVDDGANTIVTEPQVGTLVGDNGEDLLRRSIGRRHSMNDSFSRSQTNDVMADDEKTCRRSLQGTHYSQLARKCDGAVAIGEDVGGGGRRAAPCSAPHSSVIAPNFGISPALMDAYKKDKMKGVKAATKAKAPHPVVASLMASINKEHMMDLTLVGRNRCRVKTCRFIMACRIEAMAPELYPDYRTEGQNHHHQQSAMSNDWGPTVSTRKHAPVGALPQELNLTEFSEPVLRALVDYCFSSDISKATTLHEETSEAGIALVELALLAKKYDLSNLYHEAYQICRRLLNRKPSAACAVLGVATSWEVNDFETYALRTIEDSPLEALRGQDESGINCLSPDRIQYLFVQHEMDVDEITLFKIVVGWLEHHNSSDHSRLDTEAAIEAAKACVEKIELQYIDLEDLENVVRPSGLVERETLEEAIHSHAEMSAMPTCVFSTARRRLTDFSVRCDIDRILVSGAGLEGVNGWYVQEEHDDELEVEPDEILFIKSDEYSSGTESFGLFMWGSTWGIAPAMDLSNACYTCKLPTSDSTDPARQKSEDRRPPADGWICETSGIGPAPRCQWFGATTTAAVMAMKTKIMPSTGQQQPLASNGNVKRICSHESLPASFPPDRTLDGN